MRIIQKAYRTALIAAALGLPLAPLAAITPRELLTTAAFQAPDKAAALAQVNGAIQLAQAALAANPADKEAQLQYAVGIGNRAKLGKSVPDAKQARRLFESFAAANPRDPEAQLAIATWHLDTIASGFLATTILGAKKEVGLVALDRAVALGHGRAFFPGFAALMRIRLAPSDVATARRLAEQAAGAPTPTALDRIAKRQAEAVLIPLRSGDGKAAAALAHKLLPFGRIS